MKPLVCTVCIFGYVHLKPKQSDKPKDIKYLVPALLKQDSNISKLCCPLKTNQAFPSSWVLLLL